MQRLQTAARNSRNNFSGGGPPKRTLGAFGLLAVFVGGSMLISNSLFNVDGGHRAIKYKRISGVGKEIYSEGEPGCPGPRASAVQSHTRPRLTFLE